MSKVIYPELSYEVMAAVFEVHNTLGPGFVESIYEWTFVSFVIAFGRY